MPMPIVLSPPTATAMRRVSPNSGSSREEVRPQVWLRVTRRPSTACPITTVSRPVAITPMTQVTAYCTMLAVAEARSAARPSKGEEVAPPVDRNEPDATASATNWSTAMTSAKQAEMPSTVLGSRRM